ncbi:MAG: amidohydrolase [Spirochaetaceae bacterium]|jgi:predicted amidohydrolase YtcJ|nr:amidohydrolase [Spirochaetaceae bacterium]
MPVIIRNAKVYLQRGAFAEALLIDGERILAAGTGAEIAALVPRGSRVSEIDGRGGLLLPAFHDSHLHLWHFGCTIHEMDVHGARSIDDLVDRGRRALERINPPPGAVIHGAGWDQEEFSAGGGKRYPNRFDLDRISSDHPIILERVCGHTASCNTRALEMAGISGGDPWPGEAGQGGGVSDGRAELDREGRPLGVFHEKAIEKLRRLIPAFSNAQVKAQLEYGMGEALSLGLGSVECNDIFNDNFDQISGIYREILGEDRIRLRIGLQWHVTSEPRLNELLGRNYVNRSCLGHPLLSLGAFKLFADGSMGSRTAHLSVPYADDPATRGLAAMEAGAMAAAVKRLDGLGFQVIIHAIGDAAADQVLRCFEALDCFKALDPGDSSGTPNPRRHAMVHCEVMTTGLLERMARRDILALVQPAFLTHDTAIAEIRLGRERASRFLPLGSMARMGIRTAYGTDCPVESLCPLKCIENAVRRPARGEEGESCFFPEERVDVYTAVDAYTAGSAYAAFAEDRLGRIRPGYLADLTLLDRDIFSTDPAEIGKAKVLFTMVGGRIAYGG